MYDRPVGGITLHARQSLVLERGIDGSLDDQDVRLDGDKA